MELIEQNAFIYYLRPVQQIIYSQISTYMQWSGPKKISVD